MSVLPQARGGANAMHFQNTTQFHALHWFAEQLDRTESRVVALAASYRLERVDAADVTHRAVALTEADAVELVTEDHYLGAPFASGVRVESDMAPRLPRCDVLVNATAHAPSGEPAARWQVRVRLAQADGAALLDKRLDVCGPRWFAREAAGWSLGDPEPAREVSMRWELTYGGASRVPEAELDEVCFLNPLGRGWMEERYLPALERAGQPAPDRLPAPQIEDPRRPVLALDITRQPAVRDAREMAGVAAGYAGVPAGLGAVGRAWTPRIQRAGTYDDAWLRDGWPHLPADFDFAYWNAAPDDQQIESLPAGAHLELTHLVAPEHAPDGVLRVALPAGHALMRLHLHSGEIEALEMTLDRLLIDAEALRITMVWRASWPRARPVEIGELCFE